MWEELFRDGRVITRLRQGPFGPFLDEFASDLEQRRYGTATVRNSVCAMNRFGQWLLTRNLTFAYAHEEYVALYRGTFSPCPAGGPPNAVRGLHHGIAFLRRKGVVSYQPPPTSIAPAGQWLLQFDGHLDRVSGAASSTRQRYRTVLARFLAERFGTSEPDWTQLTADDLTAFVQQEAAQRHGFGRKVAAVALRSFLRFLVSRGLVCNGLIDGVPSPRQWKYAALPQRATTEQIGAVLAQCQDGTPTGLRDHGNSTSMSPLHRAKRRK